MIAGEGGNPFDKGLSPFPRTPIPFPKTFNRGGHSYKTKSPYDIDVRAFSLEMANDEAFLLRRTEEPISPDIGYIA